MARYSDDPVRHIVTFRVNSDEKKILELLAKQCGRSISDFMRSKVQLISEDETVNR